MGDLDFLFLWWDEFIYFLEEIVENIKDYVLFVFRKIL